MKRLLAVLLSLPVTAFADGLMVMPEDEDPVFYYGTMKEFRFTGRTHPLSDARDPGAYTIDSGPPLSFGPLAHIWVEWSDGRSLSIDVFYCEVWPAFRDVWCIGPRTLFRDSLE